MDAMLDQSPPNTDDCFMMTLYLGVNLTLHANIFSGLELDFTLFFLFIICFLPCAKPVFECTLCVHSYMVACTGWVMSREWENLITPWQMCVWYWFVAVLWALLQALGEGYKPLYQSDLPTGLHHTDTPHPIFVCKSVCMCVFWGGLGLQTRGTC